MTRPDLIAIGSSTGGTDPLRAMLARVDASPPPVVVVQHMTKELLPSFVAQLRERDGVPASVVTAATPLAQGRVYFAMGDTHLLVKRVPQGLLAVVSDAPPSSFHRPSIDLLLGSVASAVGAGAVGVLLSGMGADGARGLLRMRQAGAATYGQDARSSAVFGIADAAEKLGAVGQLTSPERLAALVATWSTGAGVHDGA